MRKIVIIILGYILVFAGAFLFVARNNEKREERIKRVNKTLENKEKVENTGAEVYDWMIEESKYREEYIKENFVSEESILEMAKANPNWDKIDIFQDKKEILRKNYPNGILNGIEYDNVYIDGGYEQLMLRASSMDTLLEFYLIASKGAKKDKYKIEGMGFGNFMSKEDFEIYNIDKFELVDEDGHEANYGYPMDEEHWLGNLMRIALKDDEEVGKSERFKREHPNFTGILNPYHFEDTAGIKIDWDKKKSNFEDRLAYCKVYYPIYSEDYEILVSFTTDGNNYLDVYTTNVIKKKEHYNGKYDKFDNPYNSRIMLRLVYKNRDWRKLPLTDKFKQKFSNKDGLFPTVNVINFTGINLNGRKNDKVALELLLDDGTKKYVGLIYRIKDNKIDDIETVELPNIDYSKYTKDEIYSMF